MSLYKAMSVMASLKSSVTKRGQRLPVGGRGTLDTSRCQRAQKRLCVKPRTISRSTQCDLAEQHFRTMTLIFI